MTYLMATYPKTGKVERVPWNKPRYREVLEETARLFDVTGCEELSRLLKQGAILTSEEIILHLEKDQ